MKTSPWLAFAGISWSICAQAALPTYTVQELFADLPSDIGIYSHANAISNNGWVAADRGYVGGGGYGYRCKSSFCEEIPLSGGGHHGSVSANAINNAGVVVGSRPFDAPYSLGFKWDGVTVTDLEPFDDDCGGCFLSTAANAIDRNGNIAGSAQDETYVNFPVIFRADGSRQKLPTLGGTSANTFGMNDAGVVVGSAERADGMWRGFIYDGTQMIELATLGGDYSEAVGVNQKGLVIGCSTLAGSGSQGFTYDGTMVPIPKLSDGTACPSGINKHGQIVGYQFGQDLDSVGTLYMRGKIIDLNKRLVPADRAVWQITFATAINANGEIAATARHKTYGTRRAVILVPAAAE